MNAYEKFGIIGLIAILLVIQGVRIHEWYNQLEFIAVALLFIFGHKM